MIPMSQAAISPAVMRLAEDIEAIFRIVVREELQKLSLHSDAFLTPETLRLRAAMTKHDVVMQIAKEFNTVINVGSIVRIEHGTMKLDDVRTVKLIKLISTVIKVPFEQYFFAARASAMEWENAAKQKRAAKALRKAHQFGAEDELSEDSSK